MNYHIMVDDKFIEGFIHDAEKVSRPGSNKYFLRGHSKDSVHVKTPLATWVGDILGEEFRDILSDSVRILAAEYPAQGHKGSVRFREPKILRVARPPSKRSPRQDRLGFFPGAACGKIPP